MLCTELYPVPDQVPTVAERPLRCIDGDLLVSGDAEAVEAGDTIDRSVSPRASDDDDSVSLANGSQVEGSADDTVAIGSAPTIKDDVSVGGWSGGENMAAAEGTFGGDLGVVGANEDDTVTIGDASTIRRQIHSWGVAVQPFRNQADD